MANLFSLRCFSNFNVDFWPLLKAEKVDFGRIFFFFQKSIFFYPNESIKFYSTGLLKINFIVTLHPYISYYLRVRSGRLSSSTSGYAYVGGACVKNRSLR